MEYGASYDNEVSTIPQFEFYYTQGGPSVKGIILAGGSGTRLYPITMGVSKQLMPLYNKPMVYYPLSTLMEAKIRDILIITTPEDQPKFMKLLGDGSQWGIHLEYAVQPEPKGLAQAFTIGADFIGYDSVMLVLGDNLFYGDGFTIPLTELGDTIKGGRVFGYKVTDPERYGVVGFDTDGRVTSIVEKPENPASDYAVVGLYAYDNRVIEIAKNVQPSERGEVEITSINQAYLELGELEVTLVSNKNIWADTGTFDSLHEVTAHVVSNEKRTGERVGSPDQIAVNNGWVTESEETTRRFVEWIEPQIKGGYATPWKSFVAEYRAKTN